MFFDSLQTSRAGQKRRRQQCPAQTPRHCHRRPCFTSAASEAEPPRKRRRKSSPKPHQIRVNPSKSDQNEIIGEAGRSALKRRPRRLARPCPQTFPARFPARHHTGEIHRQGNPESIRGGTGKRRNFQNIPLTIIPLTLQALIEPFRTFVSVNLAPVIRPLWPHGGRGQFRLWRFAEPDSPAA